MPLEKLRINEETSYKDSLEFKISCTTDDLGDFILRDP
jgi:hypothetical protein